MPGGDRGSARARRGHEQMPERGLRKYPPHTPTPTPGRGAAGTATPAAAGGSVRRAHVEASAQVTTPAPR